jgi:hypothetical protein
MEYLLNTGECRGHESNTALDVENALGSALEQAVVAALHRFIRHRL